MYLNRLVTLFFLATALSKSKIHWFFHCCRKIAMTWENLWHQLLPEKGIHDLSQNGEALLLFSPKCRQPSRDREKKWNKIFTCEGVLLPNVSQILRYMFVIIKCSPSIASSSTFTLFCLCYMPVTDLMEFHFPLGGRLSWQNLVWTTIKSTISWGWTFDNDEHISKYLWDIWKQNSFASKYFVSFLLSVTGGLTALWAKQ